MMFGTEIHPPIYTFRVRMCGGLNAPRISTVVWRDIEIAASQTLADLGCAIPQAFGFDNAHMWSFFLSGKAWDRTTEYALRSAAGGPSARPASSVQINDVPFPGAKGRKQFLYLFDYADEWQFAIRLWRLSPCVKSEAAYPRVIAAQGDAPLQYPGRAKPSPGVAPRSQVRGKQLPPTLQSTAILT